MTYDKFMKKWFFTGNMQGQSLDEELSSELFHDAFEIITRLKKHNEICLEALDAYSNEDNWHETFVSYMRSYIKKNQINPAHPWAIAKEAKAKIKEQ